jgi:PAS domain S-box-containing protein
LPQRIFELMTGGSSQRALHPAARWAIAAVFTLGALGVAEIIALTADYRTPFQPLYVALVVIASWAGPWPAIASLVLGTAAHLVLWVEPRGLPWRADPSDQISTVGFVVTGLLIIGVCTLLRNVRGRASRAETRLALAQQEVGVAVWEVDLRRGQVLASEQGWRMHGLQPRNGAAPLADWVAPLHPDDRGRIERRIAEAVSSDDKFEIEFRVSLPEGRERWLSARIHVHRDALGRPERTSGISLDVTEARRLRDARVASERQLRLITDALPVLIAYIDRDSRYRFVNAAYENWHGIPASSIAGRRIAELVGDESFESVEPYLERALQGETVRYRTRIASPRFGLRDLAVTYVPQHDAERRVEGVVSLIDDVTEEVSSEQRLRESEERLQLAMEGARMGTWFRDIEVGRVIWDRQHFRLLGLDPDRVMRPTDAMWLERVHPADREMVLRVLRAARDGDRPFDMQFRIVRADDGQERWLSIHGRFMGSDDGGPRLRSIGIVFDVTEQKSAEQNLRRSEALYRTLGEAVPDLVWSSGADGQPDYVNHRFTEYTGLTLEQFRSIGWTSLVHPDDSEHVRQRWFATAGGTAPFEAEFRGRRIDGEFRWLWCRSLPLHDAEGRLYKWVGFASDVTERRQTEEHLRRTESALREADKRKDEFLATLAHELRNPLAPIRYAVRLLKPESPAHLLAQGRETIDRQATHMARLLDDLLDMSRITRGAIELRRRAVDLRQAVEDSIEVARPLIDGVNHRLELKMPALPVWVNADPTRLAQIVGNLLQNAAKYTDPGGRITVAVELEGETALLRISDTGVGLAPDMRDRVFELFSQVHRSITNSRGGLGIGLAIVKRLVELHGGTIAVRSEGVGRGSEFTVRLPRSTVALPAGELLPAPVPSGARRRVLIADDNGDALESLAMLLRLSGHAVQIAHDGAAAIALAETARPDVVVLDLGMPQMSGFDVARWLRRQPWGAEIRLIAVTGWGQEEDRRRSREAGFDSHLTKPVDPDELLAQVEEARMVSSQ